MCEMLLVEILNNRHETKFMQTEPEIQMDESPKSFYNGMNDVMAN